MKLPEPVGTVQSIDALSLVGVAMPAMPPVGTQLFTDAQVRELLAQQEAAMKMALAEMQRAEAIMLRECGIGVLDRLAIKALEDALGTRA